MKRIKLFEEFNLSEAYSSSIYGLRMTSLDKAKKELKGQNGFVFTDISGDVSKKIKSIFKKFQEEPTVKNDSLDKIFNFYSIDNGKTCDLIITFKDKKENIEEEKMVSWMEEDGAISLKKYFALMNDIHGAI